ncbi:MAG: hypothetical protein JO144_14940 [Actinobacteria bacterium]|nr:hypothetical protein [Actinomycetota bacterium]
MSSPARLKNARKHESSEEEVEEELEEHHHARSTPVGGLVHKKRKSELEKLAEVPAWALAEEEEEDLGPSSRASKSGNKFASRSKLTSRQRRSKKAEPPNYEPTKDKNGEKVWKGTRSGLTWFTSVENAMALSAAGGCQLRRSGDCTGAADSIDHIEDFATVQTGLETTNLCDGKNHWNAIMLETAKLAYNGGFDPYAPIKGAELSRLAKTFAWACTPCNSAKSGKKGLDIGSAKWLRECPGGEDCEL